MDDVPLAHAGDVDHYFESADHRATFLNAVIGGEVSLKFAYAGSAAATHDRLARSSGYQGVTRAVEMEADLLAEAFPHCAPKLFDIGSGNGDHSVALLTELRRRGTTADHAVLCDFAVHLMAIAQERVLGAFPNLKLTTVVWDIESAPYDLSRMWSPNSVLLLVGHTLGNPTRPGQVLQNLRLSVYPAPRILVSVSTHNANSSDAEVLEPYKTDVFEAAAIEPFLALGVPREALQFSTSIENRGVVGMVVIRDPIQVDDVEIPAGHKVLCFRSRRFTRIELIELLEHAGWNPIAFRNDEGHLAIYAESDGT